MKTKTGVLVGIAVCVLLLTSPVLASAGYSKIYGNANEDDVLDMRDVTYIKLVIFGKKPATTLADANYDGKISMLDVAQTKLIILGKEKKLTLVDQADRTVTVNKPVEGVATLSPEALRTIVELDAVDKLVGISDSINKRGANFIITKAYPLLYELPILGTSSEANLESIASIAPDVVFVGEPYPSVADTIKETTGIPSVCIDVPAGTVAAPFVGTSIAYRLVGEIIGKEKGAEELITYINEKIAEITGVTSKIPDGEKQKVYFMYWGAMTWTPVYYDPLNVAGGINVAKECIPTTRATLVEVSKEQIIAWNPDIILIHSPTKRHKVSIEDVLSDSDLQTVNAVKDQKVYYSRGGYNGWNTPVGVAETYYMAKLFYPDKFSDLDVEEEGNEILERFYGVEGLYTWIAENCDFYRWE